MHIVSRLPFRSKLHLDYMTSGETGRNVDKNLRNSKSRIGVSLRRSRGGREDLGKPGTAGGRPSQPVAQTESMSEERRVIGGVAKKRHERASPRVTSS